MGQRLADAPSPPTITAPDISTAPERYSHVPISGGLIS